MLGLTELQIIELELALEDFDNSVTDEYISDVNENVQNQIDDLNAEYQVLVESQNAIS